MASEERLLSPRLVRGLALAAGIAGLMLPAGVVTWVTATTPLPEATEAGPLRPEMLVIPAGTYTIGGGDEAFASLPLAEVELSAFAISVTEVTRQQYELVMGEDPSTDECGPECPVTYVSWLDAVRYTIELSNRDDKTEPCYEIDGEDVVWLEECSGYRLPTAAEWKSRRGLVLAIALLGRISKMRFAATAMSLTRRANTRTLIPCLVSLSAMTVM